MGVKLQGLVLREKITFSKLQGKIIAVDAPNIIMALLNFSYKNKSNFFTDLMTDRTQRAISHLYGILYRVNFYYSKKMFPIFCFDGKDSELKRKITKDGLNDLRMVKKWYSEAIKKGNKLMARSIALSKEFLWPNILEESKKLLGVLGVPIVESPASAESQCASLVKNNIANCSVSQDFDSLLFGSPFVFQNLSKSLRRKVQGRWTYNKVEPLLIDLKRSIGNLGINQFQLVDIGILVGTDYFPGVKGIGPKKALKLVKKHEKIENIIMKEKTDYDFSQLTPEILNKVRKLFLFPEVIDFSKKEFFWNAPNKESVLHLLCEDHHLNKERVENNVDKTIVNYFNCLKYFNREKNKKISVQKTLKLEI